MFHEYKYNLSVTAEADTTQYALTVKVSWSLNYLEFASISIDEYYE